ncbi:type II RES/Xre toxin-antitoxin system antitoxin [Sphingomonas aestuarii]
MTRAVTKADETGMEKIVSLLGGASILEDPFATPLEAHASIEKGFPSKSLVAFVRTFPMMGREDTIDKVMGVSLRTFQRHKKAGAKIRLSREQSGKLYRAAEILAKAVDIFGSQKAAERFLEEPAMALDRQRPIDLLSTPAGAELVEQHLTRIDFGVYT